MDESSHFVPVVPVGTPWHHPRALAAIADPAGAARRAGLAFSQLALIGHGLYAVVPPGSHPRGEDWRGTARTAGTTWDAGPDAFLPADAPPLSREPASSLRARLRTFFGRDAGGYEVHVKVRPSDADWQLEWRHNEHTSLIRTIRSLFDFGADNREYCNTPGSRVHLMPGSTFDAFSFRFTSEAGRPPGVADGIRALRGEPLPPINVPAEQEALSYMFGGHVGTPRAVPFSMLRDAPGEIVFSIANAPHGRGSPKRRSPKRRSITRR